MYMQIYMSKYISTPMYMQIYTCKYISTPMYMQIYMTHCQDECRSLSGGVPKNLTLYWMKKIFLSDPYRSDLEEAF